MQPSSSSSLTGLYPTSRRNELDALSSPENWNLLPPRPKPEVYRFRGDNAVNHHRRRSTSTRKGGDGRGNYGRPGRSMARPASSDVHTENENETQRGSQPQVEWDKSQRHSPSYRLNQEEEEIQLKVRNRSLSHLRAMASRRKKLLAMQQQLELEIYEEKRRGEQVEKDQGDEDDEGKEMQQKRPAVPAKKKTACARNTIIIGGNVGRNSGRVLLDTHRRDIGDPIVRTALAESMDLADEYVDGALAPTPPMERELLKDYELSSPVAAAVGIPSPVDIRMHTPYKIGATTATATATAMEGLKGGHSHPQQEEKHENEAKEEEEGVDDSEEEMVEEEAIPLQDLAAHVRKLEYRLQNLGDNHLNSREQEEDVGDNSTCMSDQVELLDDVSSCDISTFSPSGMQRPPLQLRGELCEPYHQYPPVNQNNVERTNLFSDAIVESFLETLKHD